MPPRISVIIPAYNAEIFIADAINSVLAQKYNQEAEIIVIDDSSSDNTRAVVTAIVEHSPQIKLFSNERKKGPSGARNTGLLKASGEYIAFLDADDLWLPNHLGQGVNFLDKYSNIDVVFFNFEVQEYETKKKLGDWFFKRNYPKYLKVDILDNGFNLIDDDMFNALLKESFMHLQSMILRNSSRGDLLFNENIKRSEDRDFCIRLYISSKARFAYKNVITGIYFRHSNSLTSNSIHNFISILLDDITLFAEYLSHESYNSISALKLRKMIFKKHMRLSYLYRQLNDYGLALNHLLKSFDYRNGIAVSQLKQFVKIAVSFAHYNTLQRTNKDRS